MSTGTYYARVKVGGKLVRRKLKTDGYSKALLKLGDFLKEQRSKPPRSENTPTTFAEARLRFEQALFSRSLLSASTYNSPLSAVRRFGLVTEAAHTHPTG